MEGRLFESYCNAFKANLSNNSTSFVTTYYYTFYISNILYKPETAVEINSFHFLFVCIHQYYPGRDLLLLAFVFPSIMGPLVN